MAVVMAAVFESYLRFSSSRFKRVVDPKVIKAIGFTLEAFPPRADDPIE